MDTSALVRAYLPDEPEHGELRRLIFDTDELVCGSALLRVEGAAALKVAQRSGRLDAERFARFRDRFAAELAEGGAIAVIALRPSTTLRRARELVLDHPLRTLDAVHLAVALNEGQALADPEPLTFLTCDDDQRAAAEALGLAVACEGRFPG